MPKERATAKAASNRGRRCLLSLLALALLGLLAGCAPQPPQSVVQQALTYQIAHLSEPVASLVGSDRLAAHLEVQDVRIRRDRRETGLRVATGEKLEIHHLSGTYTLRVKPPGSRRPYRRKGDPFQLTLARQQVQSAGSQGLTERWLLASSSPDGKGWEVVDFLPPGQAEAPSPASAASPAGQTALPAATPAVPQREPN